MRRRALLKISSSEIDISTAVVAASAQTYTGSALTPSVTVTLNGNVIPSSGYDVTYSNNVNAGTGNITVTGKNGYRGTATGTFTINKASRTISFSDAYNVVAPSGTITKTATPSAGIGDGAVSYSISSTTYATINSSTGAVTAKTSDGSATVTATVAEGTNYLSASASYILYVFSTIHNFAYTGNVQSLLLPPGTYQFQCWGAQGGSCSSGYSGGKGGYSTGQLTLSSERTVYAFVGGQGSSSGNGGWNGGGGGSGSSSYNYGNEYGSSNFGCGGGATDIALVTSSMSYSSYRNNRSSASLLSRMIVAGGGSGGAYGYQEVTTTTTSWETVRTFDTNNGASESWYWPATDRWARSFDKSVSYSPNTTYRWITTGGTTPDEYVVDYTPGSNHDIYIASGVEFTTENMEYSNVTLHVLFKNRTDNCTFRLEKKTTSSSTTTNNDSKVGYVGGGTNGGGYSSSYYGKQNGAGSYGAFGFGANQTVTNYRYCAGCGGAGWYGGGSSYSDGGISYIRCSGGGSGFVNTAANAQYRPSGYTGLQLDSGATYDGNQSFPAVNSGRETGHRGNGYARITRL